MRTYILGQLMPDPFYVGNTSLTFGHSLGTNLKNDPGGSYSENMKSLCMDRREDDEEQMRHRHWMTIPLTVKILPRASISIERSQNATVAATWEVEIAGSC